MSNINHRHDNKLCGSTDEIDHKILCEKVSKNLQPQLELIT